MAKTATKSKKKVPKKSGKLSSAAGVGGQIKKAARGKKAERVVSNKTTAKKPAKIVASKKKTAKRATTPTAAKKTKVVEATTAAVARVFDVSERTVRHWAATTDMPKAQRNKYDLAKVVPWRLEQLVAERTAALADPNSDAARLLKAQADEREHKAAKVGMEVKVKKGELVDVHEIAMQLAEVARIFRDEAQGITRLHGKAVGVLIIAAIDKAALECRRLLRGAEGQT